MLIISQADVETPVFEDQFCGDAVSVDENAQVSIWVCDEENSLAAL